MSKAKSRRVAATSAAVAAGTAAVLYIFLTQRK